MLIKDVIDKSNELIESKEKVTEILKSIESYEQSVKKKLDADNLYRNAFIKKTSLLSALSLEFRNIYGIEPPFYKLVDTSVGIDRDGTGILSEDEKLEVDGKKTFKDCSEMISAAMFNTEPPANDPIPYCDRQSFFIDSKKAEESSSFSDPFCPPGLDRWAGDYLYDYICKDYPLTELGLYKILNGSSLSTIDSEKTIEKVFCSSDPIKFNIDNYGHIIRGNFSFDVPNEKLYESKENGSLTYPLYYSDDEGNCRYFGKSSYPYIYYSMKEQNGEKSSGLLKKAASLIPLVKANKGVSTISTGGGNLENIVVEYECVELFGLSPSRAFCNGIALLSFTENDLVTFMPLTINNSLNPGKMYLEKDTWVKEYSWWDQFFNNKPESETKENDHKYTVKCKRISGDGVNLPDNVKKAIVSYYRNTLVDLVEYYDTYIEYSKNANNDMDDSLDISESVNGMKSIIAAADEYLNSDNAELRANRFNKFMKYMQKRINFCYGNVDVASQTVTTDFVRKSDVSGKLNVKYKKVLGVNIPISIEYTNRKITYERDQIIYDISYTGSPGDEPFATTTEIKYSDAWDDQKIGRYVDNVYVTRIYHFGLSSALPPVRAKKIADFLRNSNELYSSSFVYVQSRIHKVTGSLVELHKILNNSGIAAKSAAEKKAAIARLSQNISAYRITNGFGTKTITVELQPWEIKAAFDSVFSHLTKCMVITDAKSYYQDNIIIDTKLIRQADEKSGTKGMIQITLQKEIPELMKDLNPKIVKIFNHAIEKEQ